MRNFALLGAAGFIAPRHLKAIKDTGNRLVAAMDPSDSVGILDKYFFDQYLEGYDIDFFTEFERFDRHVEKLRRAGEEKKVHFVSICTPNYLHDAHIRFALRVGADAICEKPLVLNPWNLDALAELEQETGKRVFTILQLRVHPSIISLKERMAQPDEIKKRHSVDLTYVTARGNWYFYSWKGDVQKSGGIATNIGIHFFDMLIWIFGSCLRSEVHFSDKKTASGYLELENADVRWLLSLDKDYLPDEAISSGKTTYRSINIDNQEFEFSEGFTDLHTVVYQKILDGEGFGLKDAEQSINLVYEIRNATPIGLRGEYSHPLLIQKL